MNHIGWKQIVIIYTVIFLLVILNGIIPGLFIYRDTDAVEISADRFLNDAGEDLSYRMKTEQDEKILTFSAEIHKNELKVIDSDDLGLSITKLEAQGYTVRWNESIVGYAGDPENGRANLWNSSCWFVVPKELIKEVNTLEITAYSDYEIGAYANSVRLTTPKEAQWIATNQMIYSAGISLIGIGMALFSLIITFGLATIQTMDRKMLIAMTFGMVFIALYALDHLSLPYMFISYLTYKKILFLAAFLSVGVFGFVSGWLIKSKIPPTASVISTFVFMIGAIVSKDMIAFKRFYMVGIILLPLNICTWLFPIVPKLKSSDEARFLFGGLVIICINSFWEFIALVVYPAQLAMNSFSTILIIATINMFVIALDTIKTAKLLSEKISFTDTLLTQSKMDEVTGLYNKSYCIDAIKNLSALYSVAMMDIDDFKIVNDKYGHVIGDDAIRYVADTIKSELRDDDVVARYGGDEYVAVVQCLPSTALTVFDRVRERIRKNPLVKDGMTINITLSVGVYHVKQKETPEEIISKADKALYMAKRTGKNRTVVYQSSEDII